MRPMQFLDLPSPVLAFNFNDQFDLQGIVAAADEANQPVILMLSETAIRFSGLGYLVGLFRAAQSECRARLLLELDHGKDWRLIDACLRQGFDIIMADFSDDDFPSNASKTRRVVQMAHSEGVLVEGELGEVPSTRSEMAKRAVCFTEPGLAAQFTRQTDVDLLAVSVGNLHGLSRQKPSPDFSLIRQLNGAVDVPLVLHGGDFYSDSVIRRATEAGISKANFGPELRAIYREALLNLPGGIERRPDDHRPILGQVRQRIKDQVSARLSALDAH